MVRIPACHAGGRGFESRPDRFVAIQIKSKPLKTHVLRGFSFNTHHKTFKKYNQVDQSEEIAKGIHAKTEIPIHNSFLIRSVHTESQTKKGKFERWENVQGSFALSGELPASVKHVIIVDDVITTGSTLETIIRLIKENYKIDVSVISIAYAGG